MNTDRRQAGRCSSRCAIWYAVALGAAVVGCQTRDDLKQPAYVDPERSTNRSDERFFVDVTSKVRLNFTHHAGGESQFHFPAVMSPGAAWLDYDRDGDLDLVLTDGWLNAELSGPEGNSKPSRGFACRLFRQEPPGEFIDVTIETGLTHRGYGMGLAVGDVNNDGYPDLYLTCVGPDRLFLNDHGRAFVDVTERAGIDNPRWGTSVAFLDYDRDGWLDVFVTNYVDYDPAHPCLTANGSQDFCNPAVFPRTASKLYRNVTANILDGADVQPTRRPLISDPSPPVGRGADRSGSVAFEDVSVASGIASKLGAGLGVTCCDFNRDGWIDIYVANDGHANFLWINQRDGTFRDEAGLLGVDTDALGRGQGSMGIAVADVNGDQHPDVFVTNLDGETNVLYLTQPTGGFLEASARSGLGTPSFPFTGFGTAFVDLEHDGDLDVVVVNGRVRRSSVPASSANRIATEVSAFWRPYVEQNHIYLNDGTARFQLLQGARDDFVGSVGIGRALAAGDFDNDGDLDLLVTNTAGAIRLYRNDSIKRGHWLMVRAIDSKYGGRDAYGTVVTVVAGGRKWTGFVNPGSSYLSSHDARIHFGLGSVDRVDRIEVDWPDGAREEFDGGPVDTVQLLDFGNGRSP